MSAPVISFTDGSGANLASLAFGNVDAGSTTAAVAIRVYNNKGGGTAVSDTSQTTVTTKTFNGNDVGDTVANGQEVVTDLILGVLCTSLTNPIVSPAAPTLTPSTTGGTLPAGTYNYRIAANNLNGETLAGPEAASNVTTTGTTSSIAISWTAVPGATSYEIYGRTAGAELFIAELTATTYTDTGSVTPAGAMPSSNTTAGSAVYTQVGGPTTSAIGSVIGGIGVIKGSIGGDYSGCNLQLVVPANITAGPAQWLGRVSYLYT
jgi:hypothetical protein